MWFMLLAACSENGINALELDPGEGTPEDPPPPSITVEPMSLDFGSITADAIATGTVVVGNVGLGPLTVDDLFVNGGAPVRITHTGSLSLEPGAELFLELTWAPGADLPLENNLVISSDDPDRPKVKVPLTGLVLGPDVAIDPATWDFGTIARNVPVDVPITLTNLGAVPLHVSRVEYGGSSSELTLFDDAGLSAGGVLGAGESKVLTVRYLPTDGYADEGTLRVFSDDLDTPEINATQVGSGEAAIDYSVEVVLTADDAWEGWLDGKKIVAPNANNWGLSDTTKTTLSSGDHVIAVHAWDIYGLISAFNGVLQVDKKKYSYTGDKSQVLVTTKPSSTWTDVGFDDTAWSVAVKCSNTSPWGGSPTDLVALGGQWVWWSSRCEDLGEVWIRWTFTLP